MPPPDEPYRAHSARELLTGTLLRGTIHTVTAAEHPAYAVVAAASKVAPWRRTKDEAGPEVAELERELLEHAGEPRSADELCELVESWVGRHPGMLGEAELEHQRAYRWRPLRSSVWLVRAPADGEWGPRTPTAYRAAPVTEGPPTGDALDTVIRCHLRAFGPAAAEDVACWIGWSLAPVRGALRQMDGLATFVDGADRVLYDLPDAPRPDAATEAPVRMLPWFDSTLLAYAPRRTRVLPDGHRDAVYSKGNLRLNATFLVDGTVAGVWSITTAHSGVTLTLTPLERLAAPTRKALLAEAERMVELCRPHAKAHRVQVDD
ncbi:MAG: winged helix DNA-binding domain-containing protein [Acidimicrobiales bacterium]